MKYSVDYQQQLPDYDSLTSPAQWKSDAKDILSFLKSSRDSACLQGAHPSVLAYLIARGLDSIGKSFLLVAPTDREAEKYLENLSFFWGKDDPHAKSFAANRIWHFPSRSGHKAQWLGKMEATARRLETLHMLRTAASPVVVVTSTLALLELLPPAEVLLEQYEYLIPGEQINLQDLCRRLVERGYSRVSLVEEYGDFSQRGGILDVYSPLHRWPLRMELFGDELESIRLFHPGTQRSMGVLEDAVLLPGSEIILDAEAKERAKKAIYEDVKSEKLSPAAGNVWLERIQEGYQMDYFEEVLPVFYERTATLFDYLHPSMVVVWSDSNQIRKQADDIYGRLRQDAIDSRSVHEWRRPAADLLQPRDRFELASGDFQQIWANSLARQLSSTRIFEVKARTHEDLALMVSSHPGRERLLEPLARQFLEWQKEGISSYLVCGHKEQARRLAELLKGYDVDAMFSALAFGEESYSAVVVKVITGPLEKGFIWREEGLAVVCEEEIFGKRSRRRSQSAVAGIFLNSFRDLHVGDYVVHVDHGIGVYKELAHLMVGSAESDFLLLEYQGGDRLYVPVDKLQKVQKYLGIEGEEPRVDKLGGKSWENAKKKARESAERVAEELLNLYALRQVNEGFRYSSPDQFYREFEATFSYEETPDQLEAIEDVIADMTSPRPMDRLICGDVGFGKTEVAVRAAFKAIMDGKQVAMLVPTTVLAEQHFQTFAERFTGFPLRVASLSRFKSRAQQKEVLEALKKGTVDLVVGTHRLLQSDVAFRDLGLLIIDEEHRFGVKHKEKLKQLRVSVDVLTLTATPIPRTLHMSLAGIRDLSTIETAPQDRRAIETYVCSYDEFTIREAIYRELERGGQVFFVHNHVQSIHPMAATLKKLVPQARVGVAHGQMKERDLERMMLDFVHKQIDVLVCTTIIESGLDIPAANTIIINRADKFGLAQIYQLRGRVGRSREQAFAYLIIPGEHLISRDAQKRLRALMDFSELGAGFKIALNDLQIRGGGAILGASQSGHIAAVGYELYLELLERTIREFKGEQRESDAIDPEINVSLPVFLPETYIADNDQRLLAYKRLATISEDADIDELASEWRDRYGPLPESAKNLILLARLRLLFKRHGVVRMDSAGEAVVLHFQRPEQMILISSHLARKKCEFRPESECKLTMEIWARSLPQRLLRLKRILQEMAEHASDNGLVQ
ncbi:transcription-repair coupling factor [Desulfoferrobacter suflitae]|uniref:transcription-repair coupling factor n=1 Tax=Desulfoferrobacter suflitae TaxID=2865782 RepID=UPI0021644F97|nr:transcription-repair coupling factor [Desulfoferrobacter suflitae]MCK8600400.1 transcription-repair coupling factor [Desulfoferrobacter suflitae]